MLEMSRGMTGLAHLTELDVPHPVFVAIENAGRRSRARWNHNLAR